MSNLNFTDTELWEMENRPGEQALRTCDTVPYHLAFARAFRDNEIINPHLPGVRKNTAAAGQED